MINFKRIVSSEVSGLWIVYGNPWVFGRNLFERKSCDDGAHPGIIDIVKGRQQKAGGRISVNLSFEDK